MADNQILHTKFIYKSIPSGKELCPSILSFNIFPSSKEFLHMEIFKRDKLYEFIIIKIG